MVRVKICGITRVKDALVAAKAGADAIGLVFAKSPRRIAADIAREIIAQIPPFLTPVGLFVNESPERIRELASSCGFSTVQLHGDEPPEYLAELGGLRVIKAFRIESREDLRALGAYKAQAYLLDAFSPERRGGTGKTFDWKIALEAKKFGPVILAGGLTPENVARAASLVEPYGVDVSSGVESKSGVKDAALVEEFIRAAKGAASQV
ncbi:MAG: N-(5'-phosphoribosyl)anthranilate isomerase [Planctomycetes bacterium DG_23]|nr:MAG: N-(5'-phosphoribosyl)anthranilate isomerase [Planctomycetes bacterium DG_23]